MRSNIKDLTGQVFGPSPSMTLDRIDPNGHYETGNVRWATWSEQARNKRNVR